jgi:hypothetical protein
MVPGLLATIVLGLATLISARVALSGIFMRYGSTVADPAAIDSALRLTPADAEAHYARGAAFNYLDQPESALPDLEAAVSLRPRDYFLWLTLGMTRDRLGDSAGALSCLSQAVRLAPYYAEPHWQRGNLLFRMGRPNEAFVDLRQAVDSNPDYLSNFIDLAWNASGKDASLTEQVVQAQSDKAHLALAIFFADHGRASEAIAHFGVIQTVSLADRRRLIKGLLTASAYRQAFEVWTAIVDTHSNREPRATAMGGVGTIYDGGFEAPLNLDDVGFGWHVARGEPGLGFSIDPAEPQRGSRSLRIDFTGNPNPGTYLLSQLIITEPNARYRLSFAARTKNVVSGGALVMSANDANGDRLLASSAPLPGNTGGWQSFGTEFVTGASTQAIILILRRQSCASLVCPVFGSVNLDGFSLERTK